MTEKTRQSSTISLQEPASPTKKVDFVKGHRRNFSAAPRLEKTPFTFYKLQSPTVTVSVSTAQDTNDLNLTIEPSKVIIGNNAVEPRGVKSSCFGTDLYKIKNPQP